MTAFLESQPCALTFDPKTGVLTFKDTEASPGIKVLEIRLLRHLLGDRLCLGKDGSLLDIVSGDAPTLPGTEKIILVDTDLIILRLDREENNWAILSWPKETVKDLLTRIHMGRGNLLPLRRATDDEKLATIPIRLGTREKQPPLCKEDGCRKPCEDTCTLCERPFCTQHMVPCLVGPFMMAGYCSTCLHFLGPLPLEKVLP
jgi:hypothetical protein